ncbi:MAG TPA: DNA-binding transcriptional regulator [Tepidisphaeraceae bacterium]|jgi:putative transcriptional regulator|nr:DNA-binding transcriptional regulator [Tepidisphaeraceae bacterium]
MKNKRSCAYRSEAFAAIHETMEAFHRVGATGKTTMREFDEACPETVEEIQPAKIRALREREHVSQPVFARYLNVSKNLVSDWERGKRKPGGPALRLLSVIEKHGIDMIS